MNDFSQLETVIVREQGMTLFVTLNRPDVRNAMSLTMVRELISLFNAIQDNLHIRAVVLRGAGGHFCAGGDIKDMAGARAASSESAKGTDPYFTLNRQFGQMIAQVNKAPQVVIVVLEGAVLGGGFGLACVSDIAIAASNAKFGLPETGLGIPPAQIAPFVVNRIGLTQARRLALLGARFNGQEAYRLGLVHDIAKDNVELEQKLEEVLEQIQRCAPQANRTTKALMLAVGSEPLETLLDNAARTFSEAVQGKEGQEGTKAFIQKRLPAWAETQTPDSGA